MLLELQQSTQTTVVVFQQLQAGALLQICRSRRHGLLVGRGSSRLSLRFIDKDPDVRPGDLVATSPASTLLPPNVPVGVIQSVEEQAVPAPVAVVQLIAAPEAIDWVQVQTR